MSAWAFIFGHKYDFLITWEVSPPAQMRNPEKWGHEISSVLAVSLLPSNEPRPWGLKT